MTLIGSLISSLLQLVGFKPKKNQYGYVFEIGKGWGGVEMGPFAIVNENPNQYILDHEFGHSLQNCYIGPFMPFISIASAFRYWYREYLTQIKGMKYSELPDYDDIWFEGTATYLGKHYHKYTD
jgi:hypothetical protein